MDLLHRVGLIEERLKEGTYQSRLRLHDLELLKQIVESFHKVWRLFNQYPSHLGSKLDKTLFLDIFEEMYPVFLRHDSSPSLNNDVGYSSFQMDKETSEHSALMANLQTLITLRTMEENDQGVPYSSSIVDNLNADNISQHENPMRIVIQEGSEPTEAIKRLTVAERMNENSQELQPHQGSQTLEDPAKSSSIHESALSIFQQPWKTVCDVNRCQTDNQRKCSRKSEAVSPTSRSTGGTECPSWTREEENNKNGELCFSELLTNNTLISSGSATSIVQSHSSDESVLHVERIDDHRENQANNAVTADGLATARSDPWIQRRGNNTNYCDLCECELLNDETSIQQHINERRHQKDNQWISISQGAPNAQYYSCDLCNVSSTSFNQLKQHFDARNHHDKEIEYILHRFVLERLEESSDQDAEANYRTLRRTNYLLNESCIIRSRCCGSPTFFNCILCDVDMIGDDRVLAHLKDDRTHRMKLDEIIRNFDANTLPFEVDDFNNIVVEKKKKKKNRTRNRRRYF